MKSLLTRNPELLPTLSQRMLELRGQFISLAEERAQTREQAELAVALVMAAVGRVMHEAETSESISDEPLADRLRATVDALVAANQQQLCPISTAA